MLSSRSQPIYKTGEENIWLYKCIVKLHKVGGFFPTMNICHLSWKSRIVSRHLSEWASECNLQSVWRCFSCSGSTLSLFMLRAAPGREVSGPIMRNTCWLTQIENTARWESGCSWSTHVTSSSNHCPASPLHPPTPTTPAPITAREILPCDDTPEKTRALNVIPFVSSIRASLSDD